MIILYILGGIFLLILLLLSVKVEMHAAFDQTLKVDAKIGPFRLSFFPKTEENRKKSGKKREKNGTKPENKRKEKPVVSLKNIRSAMPAVWESLQRGLKKMRQKIQIDPLSLCLIFGGEDPAETAEWYGWASSTLWTVMPVLQKRLRMPHPQIHLGVDFNAPKTIARGEVGIRCRIGGLLAIARAFVKPIGKWYVTRQKQKRQADKRKAAEPKNSEKKAA